jgi:hypothetical protein
MIMANEEEHGKIRAADDVEAEKLLSKEDAVRALNTSHDPANLKVLVSTFILLILSEIVAKFVTAIIDKNSEAHPHLFEIVFNRKSAEWLN